MFPAITLLSVAGVYDLGSVERCPLHRDPLPGMGYASTQLQPVRTGNRGPLSFSTPELGKASKQEEASTCRRHCRTTFRDEIRNVDRGGTMDVSSRTCT
jgi:hypothetical protein